MRRAVGADGSGETMSDATIRFMFDATGTHAVTEQLRQVAIESRFALARIALGRAKRRLHRAYLNMLRSTRRNRKEAVRKWMLAKLHVRAAKIRVEKPNAEVRIVSHSMKNGEPIVLIDAIFARKHPSFFDRWTKAILLGLMQ